ncbi:MAG: hypothetical protein ACREJ9_04260 [Candidatus Rokuibacteriota bacterium]
MKDAIRSLRSEARQLTRGKVPKAIRYPVAFREAVAALTRAQLDEGASMNCVAGALGLPARSLARWLQQSAPPVLRPVTVRPDPAPAAAPGAGLVLLTPQGLRVEGLDRDTLITMLRVLG